MQTINPEVPAMPEENPSIQLDSEEQELLSDYDAGAWRSVATPGVLQSLREAARATGQKDQLDIQEQPAIQAAR
jgi:gamma-glutamyltranspeptidase